MVNKLKMCKFKQINLNEIYFSKLGDVMVEAPEIDCLLLASVVYVPAPSLAYDRHCESTENKATFAGTEVPRHGNMD